MKKSVYILSIVASLLLFLSLNSCNKNEDFSGYEIGYLKNLTGFDGCGWIIELTDGQKLEPTNLGDYEIPFKENQKVFIQYRIPKDIGSICMVGKVVEITNLKLP